jgi:hypothetical protein
VRIFITKEPILTAKKPFKIYLTTRYFMFQLCELQVGIKRSKCTLGSIKEGVPLETLSLERLLSFFTMCLVVNVCYK